MRAFLVKLVILSTVIISFQNCSPSNFNASSDSSPLSYAVRDSGALAVNPATAVDDPVIDDTAPAPEFSKMQAWERAKSSWQVLFPVYKENIEMQLAGKNTMVLYNAQYFLMNFAMRARQENDVQILSQLSEVATVAPLRWLVNSEGKGLSVPTSWRDIAGPVTWADAKAYSGKYDNLNNLIQWMYFTGYLMHSVAQVPTASRTEAMKLFLDVYSAIFSRNIPELIFNAQNGMNWDLRGWTSCSSSRLSHYDITVQKYSGAMKAGENGTAPCNAVLDWDEQLWAATLEYRAAVALDPAHVNYVNDNQVDQRIMAYLRTAFDAVEGKMSWTSLTDFRGRAVDGYLFNKGLWSLHPDFAFAGNAKPAPPSSKETSVVAGVGEDMAHHIRLAWVLLSFYQNKGLVGRVFPRDADMKYYANQVVYQVFNGDFTAPRFASFDDGSNGWFRMDFTNGASTKGGPWIGALPVILGAYGFYSAFQPDVSLMIKAILPAYQDSEGLGPGVRASLTSGYLKNCTYNSAHDSWSSCESDPDWVGFRAGDSETLAFFSQYAF